jgi:ABC-type antimicrobial peptide transport system permease subunit
MIMGYGLMLASVGLVIGLLGSQFLTDLLSSLLFGVQPTDLAVFAAVSVFLVLVALVASVVPTVRALRVDPLQALRHE